MFLLDTNTLIYFFKGQGRVAERLLATSPAEVAMRSSRSCRFFRSTTPPAQAAAMVRAELERRGRPIGPLDNLIAGTALAHRATLVTRNTREFSRLPNLAVMDWYS
jgi:tRNA(fMet)-specific endonuclease VapC